MKFYVFVLIAFFALGGCTESTPTYDGPVTLEDMATEDAYASAEPGPASLRRLTRSQFQESIHALFGETVVVPKLSEPDIQENGLLSIGASITTFSPRGVENLESTSYSIAEQVVEQGLTSQFMTCTPSGTVDEACSREFIETFGRMAWRRPLSTAEVDELLAVTTQAAQTLGAFDQGLVFAMATALQSPYFLFRVELGADDADGEFSALELASRLSYLMWNSTPDEELLTAAESGSLKTREGLFAKASRLLDHPNSRLGLRNFFTEQFQLYKLDSFSKDPIIFEHYHAELGPNAREETLRLLEHIVFDINGDFRESATADYSFVNSRLAALYALPAPVMDGFGVTELPESSNRVGLLGHASFLGLHSHSISSSATLRGKAVRNIFLCQEIPAPPVNVDTSIPEPSGTTRTLRERVAEHLTEPGCASCHLMTDPIGLALENFDAIARYRETDNGEVIDASGELDGETFDNMIGLAEAIRKHPGFAPCMAQTLSHYGMGREVSAAERNWMATLAARFEVHGYRMKRFLLEFVMSPLFNRVGAPVEESDAGEVSP